MSSANEKGKNVQGDITRSPEPSAEELFRQAFEKQAEDIGKTLETVFVVNINHVNKGKSDNNYVLEVLVTLDGDVLNVEHYKDYCIMRNVRVSSGYLILNSITDGCSKIPLIDDYICQIEHADVITTIFVSKKKMKK